MANIKKVSKAGSTPKRSRGTSGTAYPYFDLNASIEVARTVHEKGGGLCESDALAAWLNYASIRSGTYLTRVAAARQFGLITIADKQFSVTDRAQKILAPVMPEDAVDARANAFLAVELFQKVHDQFLGHKLPPPVGLQNLFKNTYKIVPDRVSPAVRVFLASAEQAGFFSASGDKTRLIRPVKAAPKNTPDRPPKDKQIEPPPPPERPKGTGGGGDGPTGVHSAIVGLLRELPAAGTAWKTSQKTRFLDAFKATIDFIYPEEDAP